MSASVASRFAGLPASASQRRRIRPLKTGSGDGTLQEEDIQRFAAIMTRLYSRIRSNLDIVGDSREPLSDSSIPIHYLSDFVRPILQPAGYLWSTIPIVDGAAPPDYDYTVLDSPPDYTTTDTLATVQFPYFEVSPPLYHHLYPFAREPEIGFGDSPISPKVDFSNTDNLRERAKKKAAAKKADAWKDEEKKEDNAGKQNAGGGDGDNGGDTGGAGGGNSGGDGGDGGGGGGGDDGDDWGFGGSKKKKKGKKGKAAEADEEEEKKKQEEEEAAAAAPMADSAFSIDTGDAGGDANPDDEWGGFATAGKKKKGKKGKGADPMPPPPPPPPPAPADLPAEDTVADMYDINLDDGGSKDDGAPKLDLSFGGAENKSSGMFGGVSNFLGGWGSNNSWSFNDANKDSADTSNDAPASSNPWDLGGSKKNKKKTATNDFDFNFDSGAQDIVALDPPAEEKPAEDKQEDDAWGIPVTTKKGKKGKKGAAVAVVEEPAPPPPPPPPPPAEPEPEPAKDDNAWSFGGGGKKDKKNKKNNSFFSFDDPEPEAPAVVDLPPEAEVVKVEEDPWAWSTSAKDKKKGKKGAAAKEPDSEPAVVVIPEVEAEPAKEDNMWGGGWGAAPSKSKKKKGVVEVVDEPIDVPPPPPPPPAEPEPPPAAENDDIWGLASTTKKGKKGKKGKEEPAKVEEPVVVVPEPEPIVVVPEPEPEPPVEDSWGGGWGAPAKDKKKAKKAGKAGLTAKAEEPPAPEKEPEPIVVVPETDPAPADDGWGDPWGAATSKKSKKPPKGGFADPVIEDPPIVEVPLVTLEDEAPKDGKDGAAENDWMDWGSTSKTAKKKGKKGAIEEVLPEAPPPPPAVPEPAKESKEDSGWGFSWGSAGKKDKGKKGKEEPAPPPPPPPAPEPVVEEITMVPDAVDEPKADGEDDFGWGFGKKDKKKKPSKKDDPVEVIGESLVDPVMQPESIQETKSQVDEDPWGFTSTKKGKKGKKGSAMNPPEAPPAPTPPEAVPDAAPDEPLPPPPPPPLAALPAPEPEPAKDDDIWGLSTGKKAKKGKKSALSKQTTASEVLSYEEPVVEVFAGNPDGIVQIVDEAVLDEPPPPPPPEPVVVEEKKSKKKEEEKPAKSMWGSWGLGGSKSVKDKEKERKEKEKKEAKEKKEERQRIEKEEAERIAREAEEAAEKERLEAEEKARKEAEEAAKFLDDPNEIMEIVDEAPKKKGKKVKKGSKIEPVQEPDPPPPPPPAAMGDDELLDLMGDANEDQLNELLADTKPKEEEKSSAWSFWGAPLKSTKKSTPSTDAKSAVNDLANQNVSLIEAVTNVPEVVADEPPPPPKATKTATTKGKKGTKSSIADRIAALQGGKEERIDLTPPAPPTPPPEPIVEPVFIPEPEPVVEPPVVEVVDVALKSSSAATKKSSKKDTKDSKASSSKKKEVKKEVKAPTPPLDPVIVVPEPEPIVVDFPSVLTPLPGGFPTEDLNVLAFEDPASPAPPSEIVAVVEEPKADKKAKKDKKSKKVVEAAKEMPPAPPPAQQPSPPADFDMQAEDIVVMPEAPSKLPTPPPEPAKKERARVVRNGASSWGMWAAAPSSKGDSHRKPKDDTVAATPANERSAHGLSRSKSSRTPKEVEKSSKSSGSDQIGEPSKPKPTRASTGFSLFGAPTPARSRSTRQAPTPKTQSRRASVDPGTISPGADDAPRMSSKAAKIMGVGVSRGSMSRRASTKDKGKRRSKSIIAHAELQNTANVFASGVPDPYAIDDDLVMVDGHEDSAPAPPDITSGGEDAVLVDLEANIRSDGPDVVTGPEDMAFVEPSRRRSPPKQRERATSSAKREGIMGMFGLGRSKSHRHEDRYTRPSTSGGDAERSHRKRSSHHNEEDEAKRLRRDDRRVHRSRGLSNEEGIMTDAVPNTGASASTENEARNARRGDRDREAASKAARAAELAAAEEKAARRRERDRERQQHEARKLKERETRDRRIREEQELENRRREEKRARHAARDQRRAAEERYAKDAEASRSKGRDRRDKDRGEPSSRPQTADRPKTERRRTDMDDAARRQRHEERRQRRTTDRTMSDDKTSRRRSTANPIDDYFDPRNGAHAPYQQPRTASGRPYLPNGGDKTTSWVASVNEEQPDPPPLAETVIEPPPDLNAGETTADEEALRGMRTAGRGERNGDADRRRRRHEERRHERKSGGEGLRSEGSSGDRKDRRRNTLQGYGDSGVRWDARPSPAPKRQSWLKSLGGKFGGF
ncbi:hypothetical protein H2201_001172 [Coniosporium apollinis]|uniref:Uncharacterized protein n=1 Tax=Coniosporium apollinis TaxID=61459 RepID=A0ABQ9P3G9_9PEZI|nr:hypothetical protein H2201_001172 [Coniosporium apollinis]